MKTQNRFLFYYGSFLTSLTLLLIFAGGLVTSHEAGLAVPDWPLSYGQLMPPMVGNVFWEHGHRMIAGIVGILTLIFALCVQKLESRRSLKKLAWICVGAVIAQALLGGLTVLLMLPDAVSIVHACLAQTFFCLLITLTYFLSPLYQLDRVINDFAKRAKKLAFMTTGFIFLQLILGAAIRHSPFTVIPHVVVAFLVLLHIFLLAGRLTWPEQGDTILARAAMGLGIAAICQAFLGLGAYALTRVLLRGYAPGTAEIYVTAVHQTLGAVILGLSVFLSVRVSR